jgi:hypothetical protein
MGGGVHSQDASSIRRLQLPALQISYEIWPETSVKIQDSSD